MSVIETIQHNLEETRLTLHRVFDRMSERGAHVQVLEDQADELLENSESFYYLTLPPWRRYLRSWIPPAWWWQRLGCASCCYRKKKKLLPARDA